MKKSQTETDLPDNSSSSSFTKRSHDEIKRLIQDCEPNCKTCEKFLSQLSQHILKAHSLSHQNVELKFNTAKVGTHLLTLDSSCPKSQSVGCNSNRSLRKRKRINYAEEEDNSDKIKLFLHPMCEEEQIIPMPLMKTEVDRESFKHYDENKSMAYSEEIPTVSVVDDTEYCSDSVQRTPNLYKFQKNTDRNSEVEQEELDNILVSDKVANCSRLQVDNQDQKQESSMGLIKIKNIESINKPVPSSDKEDSSLDINAFPLPEKPFKCHLCIKDYFSGHNLNRHLRIDHKDQIVGPYLCKVCKGRFLTGRGLRNHFDISHPGEIPYHCKICKKGFPKESQLNYHMLTHTGEKPHECDICQKKFGMKSRLNRHFKIHTGERPHICDHDQCEKSFVEKEQLIQHLRTHTGRNSFICKLCNQSFSTKSKLQTHVLLHKIQ